MQRNNKNKVVIFQTKSGAIELKGDIKKETLWANLQQIADLFETDKSGISRHINNIYQTNELEKKLTVAKIATVKKEGKREVERMVEYYNLDIILSVGYRVNSKKATEFRKWATKTLHDHITKGYTINRTQIKNHYSEFAKAVENIKALLPPAESFSRESVLELISAFSNTWLSLDAYDKDELSSSGTTKRSVELTAEQLTEALVDFKIVLINKGETTELFGSERQPKTIQGIVGNVMQSFGGKAMYPTIEEKAAHLLYFMVKNHPFTDGNKRSGAYTFIWFLKKAGILNLATMSPTTLTAITLLVAESDPKNKERMIKLILQLLRK